MKMRKLRDLEVSAIGMGCMGFTHSDVVYQGREFIRKKQETAFLCRILTETGIFRPLALLRRDFLLKEKLVSVDKLFRN